MYCCWYSIGVRIYIYKCAQLMELWHELHTTGFLLLPLPWQYLVCLYLDVEFSFFFFFANLGIHYILNNAPSRDVNYNWLILFINFRYFFSRAWQFWFENFPNLFSLQIAIKKWRLQFKVITFHTPFTPPVLRLTYTLGFFQKWFVIG